MSTSLQIARELADALRSSIAELEKANHHDEQLLRYLNHVLSFNTEHLPSPPRPTDEKTPHVSAPKQGNMATAVDDQEEISPLAASLPSKLDEILSLARTTREKKTNKIEKGKDNGKTSKLSSTNQVKEKTMGRVDVNKKGEQLQQMKQQQQQQQNIETVVIQRPTVSLRQYLNSQFTILKRLRKYTRALMSSRLLDESQVHHHQQQCLSLVNGRPTLPRSHLFVALSRSITTPSSPHNTDHIPALNRVDQSHRLVEMIRKIKDQYMRSFKGKFVGVGGTTKLSPEDMESILSIWYKLHRCMEVSRNHNINTSDASVPAEIIEDRQVGVRDLVESIMAMAKPIPVLPKNDATVLSREWLRFEMDRIERENRTLENNISLLMETTIGRYELKDTLKSLRRCCETEGKGTFTRSTGNNRVEISENDPWVVSLKQYRAVYRCLSSSSDGANRFNQSCFFLPTSTTDT